MNARVSKSHLLRSNACLNLIQGSQSNFFAISETGLVQEISPACRAGLTKKHHY
jgi:hypothetical protein